MSLKLWTTSVHGYSRALQAIVDQANKVLAQNLLATPADDQEPIIRMKSARPDHIARSRACKVAAATKLIRAGSTPNCS